MPGPEVVTFLSYEIAGNSLFFFSVATWSQSRCLVRLSSQNDFCSLFIILDLFLSLCTRDTHAGGYQNASLESKTGIAKRSIA